MNPSAIVLCLGLSMLSTAAIAQPATAAPEAAEVGFAQMGPGWQGPQYFGAGEYGKLEAFVADLMKSRARTDDGKFVLQMVSSKLSEWLELWDEDTDSTMKGKLAEWQEKFPSSAMQPIVAAMQMHATAWRARGRGYSSSVTDEGWQLFQERNARAWKILMDHKKQSSTLPIWYEQAILIGNDAGLPPAELRELFDEGIRRHPGFYPIYFAYARQFAPRWGGDYAAADAFIREQTAAKTNPDGEQLYTRLYWLIDQYEDGSPSFFQESRVDWPRMRKGFEQLMIAFPKGEWNLANFAAYACRAQDSTTYGKLRPKLNARIFTGAGPSGISLEVCDARFLKST